MSASAGTTPLTIVCWLWHGKKPIFDQSHVHCLKRQCEHWIKRTFRFVCITDQKIDGVEKFPLWDFPKVARGVSPSADCWRRLRLWDTEIGYQLGERILSADLGILLRADISEWIDESLPFQAMEGRFTHINAGLMTMVPGTNQHIWDSFDPEHSPKAVGALCGSDQAWLSHLMPDAPVWRDGILTIQQVFRGADHSKADVIKFPGAHKPWHERVKRKARAVYREYMEFHG